jgi:2-polyprenyl-3-methyl-5-hydroxy-6-metoxy-1,4-benzoquinol methylase
MQIQEKENRNMLNARIPFYACPLCESRKIEEKITGDCSKHLRYVDVIPSQMRWMECEQCKHQFIDGYFSEEALKVIFSTVGERQTVGFDFENQRKISARIIEKVLPFKTGGTWLDVGFGNGSLLFTAEEYGFEVIGVDLRPQSVAEMKRLGYNVYCELIQNLSLSQSVSVVSLMDVLEHVPYPKEILKYLFDNMEDDGCLILSMPNSENLLWRLMTEQNKNPYYGELEHYHNFSRSRLIALLDECGFNLVRYGISERYRCCMEVIAVRH